MATIGEIRQNTMGELRIEHDKAADELHANLMKFHAVLSDPRVGGEVTLGTDPKKINWRNMSHAVAACFRPEFTFQREEITRFYITTDNDKARNEMRIKIALERFHSDWSEVAFGVVVGSPFTPEGDVEIRCEADMAQVTAAREAMATLDEGLWGPTSISDAKDLRNLVRSSCVIKEGQMLLEFAVGVLEKQLSPKPARKK